MRDGQDRQHVRLAEVRHPSRYHDDGEGTGLRRAGRRVPPYGGGGTEFPEGGRPGTTYGGNPFACAAVCKVLELYEKERIVEHVRGITPYFEQKLDEIAAQFPCIQERRGSGLMQGLVFDRPVAGIIQDAMDHGLVLINAGPDILRFVPPLVITRQNIDEMVSILVPAIERQV